jgi:malate synthase
MQETAAMPAATMPEERKAATLEDVWAVIREIGEKHKENDRWLEEYRQETDRQMKEQWDKTNKKLGDLSLRFGDIIEHLIAPNLTEKFKAMNFGFTTAGPNRKFYDSSNHQELAEVDILLRTPPLSWLSK